MTRASTVVQMLIRACFVVQLVLGGPPECPERPFCAAGFKKTYNMEFRSFKALDPGGPLTKAAFEVNASFFARKVAPMLGMSVTPPETGAPSSQDLSLRDTVGTTSSVTP